MTQKITLTKQKLAYQLNTKTYQLNNRYQTDYVKYKAEPTVDKLETTNAYDLSKL